MLFDWFNAADAAKAGAALADQFSSRRREGSSQANEVLKELLQQADPELRNLRLNFYKKAKFANSFKWKLLENGVDRAAADEITQQVVMRLSGSQGVSSLPIDEEAAAAEQPTSLGAKQLLARGNKSIEKGDYDEAIRSFQDMIRLDPRHAVANNNLGAAFFKLGRYKEAEYRFQQAARLNTNYPDALSNIGSIHLLKGEYTEAENFLRRALQLNPRLGDARVNLGLTLAFSNRLRDAKVQFDKALKFAPGHAAALFGMAFIAKTEGSFEQAENFLKRALKVSPQMPRALASHAGMRRMTRSDTEWLKSVQTAIASDLPPDDEAELRFAIGKYYDDTADFKLAFQNYKRGNELLKSIAEPFDRVANEGYVDSMIRGYPLGFDARSKGSSDSMKPVFVVGMPRSGTSLTEQIISSHPAASGAGELGFWSEAAPEYGMAFKDGLLGESSRAKLADAYLRVLEGKSAQALRVVDKMPVNASHLGLIHSVFPNARIIYMQRDPIDTCLSCYFQKFILPLNFTMDLSDLAAYYRQHHRLMAHWRAALPAGTIMDVPYEELVADQAGWTRKILDFIGLEWNDRVMEYHKTNRAVVTASFWQVRQKIYSDSVRRWRNYEIFIDPLKSLKGLT